MAIELGGIRFDEGRLYKQLRNELKDDWFPDPFNFGDMLSGGIVDNAITKNFEENHGQYIPSERTILNIPKPNFTLRYALEVGLPDRALYQGIASYLAPRFDPLIPWYVYSHRQNPHRHDDRYLFRHGVEAWKDFSETARSAINSDNYLLSTDLTNYFDNIDLALLKNKMLQMISRIAVDPAGKSLIRAHILILFDCLKYWAYDSDRGLPQNRDASSFLANIYMCEVDLRMRGQGYEYYRYMDDIKVICADEFEARMALKKLSIELREIGLSVNSKKTAIVAGSNIEEVRRHLDVGPIEIESIDAMWKTRQRKQISQAFPILQQLTQDTIRNGRVDSREFRYCIARMALVASCEDFAVPHEYFSGVTNLIVPALARYPASTDQFVKYLRVVPLTNANLDEIADHICDKKRNFYSWQNYRLWLLLGERGYRSDRLIDYALGTVSEEKDGANRAGASIYGGAVGGNDARIRIAHGFHEVKSFFGQRAALIGVHELPFKPEIDQHVRPYVRSDLRGVYRQLQKTKGRYFAKAEKTSIATFVDSERDYA